MSTPANFNGARPVIDVNDAVMLLIDHQSGLFQTSTPCRGASACSRPYQGRSSAAASRRRRVFDAFIFLSSLNAPQPAPAVAFAPAS